MALRDRLHLGRTSHANVPYPFSSPSPGESTQIFRPGARTRSAVPPRVTAISKKGWAQEVVRAWVYRWPIPAPQRVHWGGVAATSVVVVSATTITANTGAHAAGLADVVVTNPDTQTGTRVSGFQLVTPFESLVAGATPIQAIHFTGLLSRINIQLGRFGRPAHAFTNLVAPGATVQARDLTELYAALNDALDAAGEPALAVPTVTAGVTIPVTSHLTSVRAKVLVLEALEVP